MKPATQATVVHISLDLTCLVVCTFLYIPNAWWVTIVINLVFWMKYRKALLAEAGQLHEDEPDY